MMLEILEVNSQAIVLGMRMKTDRKRKVNFELFYIAGQLQRIGFAINLDRESKFSQFDMIYEKIRFAKYKL